MKGFRIINPIIPIIFGLLVEKYGTSLFPIYLTGIIFFGQCISIIATLLQWKYIVILGLFVSGLCMSPLVIVQKTLIIEIFQEDNLGIYISILLSVGKLISFISSFFANTFSQHSIYDTKIFFIVSSVLSFFSFSISIAYFQIMNKNKTAVFITFKKKSIFKHIETMSIYFWWYLLIFFLSSCICTPFIYFLHKIEYTHFLENIIAADISLTILLLSVASYPIIGWVNDNYGHRLVILLISLIMSIIGFMTLLLSTRFDTLFITLFSVGQSVSSIILVLLPIYISKNVSTIFGFCKSIEIIGNVIMQSVIHIILNFIKKKELTNTDINAVIMLFGILNMFLLVFLAAFYRHDNIHNKKYINHCLYNLFHKKSKIMYQDIMFRSKEITLRSTRTYLGFIATGLILSWILYFKVVS